MCKDCLKFHKLSKKYRNKIAIADWLTYKQPTAICEYCKQNGKDYYILPDEWKEFHSKHKKLCECYTHSLYLHLKEGR